MEITVSIPDKFVPAARTDADVSRQMLEAFAIENYRQEKLSIGQIVELLEFSIDETNAFLKKHHILLRYTRADLAEDRRAIEKFIDKLLLFPTLPQFII